MPDVNQLIAQARQNAETDFEDQPTSSAPDNAVETIPEPQTVEHTTQKQEPRVSSAPRISEARHDTDDESNVVAQPENKKEAFTSSVRNVQNRNIFTSQVIATLDAYRGMLRENNGSEEHSLIVAGFLGVPTEKADSEADIVLAILDADPKNYETLKVLVEAYSKKDTDRVFYLLECNSETLDNVVSTLVNISGEDSAQGMSSVEKVKFAHPLIEGLSEMQVGYLRDALKLLEASRTNNE